MDSGGERCLNKEEIEGEDERAFDSIFKYWPA